MKRGLKPYPAASNRLVAAFLDGKRLVFQCKRVAADCPLTKEERWSYVHQSAAVAVRMIKERRGCSLREAVDILQSAK